MRQIKTLLACWDEATEFAIRTLGDDFNVSVVHTLSAARSHLEANGFDLIVVTIRFDESRPLELLPLATKAKVPVAIVRFGISQLAQDVVAGMFVAARSLGCRTTLDLSALSKDLGRDAAIREFRAVLKAAATGIVD
jgi:hypothetical protein